MVPCGEKQPDFLNLKDVLRLMGNYGALFIWSVEVGKECIYFGGKKEIPEVQIYEDSVVLRVLREGKALKKTVYRMCLQLNTLRHPSFIESIVFDATLLPLERLPFEIWKC